MIPALLDPRTRSPGERTIFQKLRDEPGTEGWIVLHSLAVSHHIRQVAGEVDFVVIIPSKGVLGVEVKAARTVTRGDDGLWRIGGDDPEPRGPFRQASEGTHSIRKRVMERSRGLGNVIFWSAVIFTRAPFTVNSDEWHSWQVIDGPAFRAHPLSESLMNVIERARAFLPTCDTARWFRPDSNEPTPQRAETIARILRPDFELVESPKAARVNRADELLRFTQEQFEALDQMRLNPRVLFEGPAGTGKTLLAVEAARRAVAGGRRTLLLCFNRALGDWLRRESEAIGAGLTAKTLHSYLLGVSETQPPPRPRRSYWQTELPALALASLLDRSTSEHLYDELIVDEAQDLLHDDYLDALDASLAGGLSAGNWRIFGDFERQALYDDQTTMTPDSFISQRVGSAATFSLRTNCRNTPRIAEMVGLLARLEPPYSSIRRPDSGIDPDLYFYATPDEQTELLLNVLKQLRADGFHAQDTVILSPHSGSSCAEGVPSALSSRWSPIAAATPNSLRYGTIHTFKGLEAPAVIVTDIDSITGSVAEALFYVAMTRATDRLVLLLKSDVRREITALLASRREAGSRPMSRGN